MELWHFEFLEEGPKTQKSAKIGPLDPGFFSRPPPRPFVLIFSGIALGANEALEKSERLGPF